MTAYIIKKPDSITKLRHLGRLSRFDVSGYPAIFPYRKRFNFIYPAVGKNGKCIKLFKVLQSNECINNCYYCANRCDRIQKRFTFKPEELAKLFMQFYNKGFVEGLFLSSALRDNPTKTQEETLKTIELLRKKYKYQGYIHYKILPGADKSIIYEASRLSNRLSINLEAPSEKYLKRLSPSKNFQDDLLDKLNKIAKINEIKPLKAGITTQLVIGAVGEKDSEIINTVFQLYKNLKLWRIYYSNFYPISQTPLENNKPCSPWREYRLYQADFLIRKYRFSKNEFIYDDIGNLPLDKDPKLLWAEKNPEKFPIEINKATFWQLIRIPGIGRISAQRILRIRKQNKIKNLQQLQKMGTIINHARNFITLDGKLFPLKKKEIKPQPLLTKQLFFWEEL